MYVRANGYTPQEITTVAYNSGITTQDIFLQPVATYALTLNLYHSTMDIVTIDGFIKDEFGDEEIQITTGDNVFQLPAGDYTVVFTLQGM